MAYFTARRRFFGRSLLLSMSAVSLCVPSLIVALGYVSFWGINGSVNRLLGTSFSFLYTTAGIVIAQGFYNVPFVTGIVSDAWERLPREQENAARLLGAGEARILRTVTLRQLSGAIGAACIPVFLFCYFSFMIVLLFSPVGKSTLEVEIYHSIRTTLDVAAGAKLAALETLTAFGLVFVYGFISRRSQTASSGVDYVAGERRGLGASSGIFFPLFFLILIFLICPLFSVFVSGAGELGKLFKSSSFWKSVLHSLETGLATGFLCTLLGFAYSVAVKLGRKQGSV
ncbi:MAG: ABC transporter permease subunit, partial [Treponema sp.]|nr:ABC transporter permease subunit [Treponema sp.]